MHYQAAVEELDLVAVSISDDYFHSSNNLIKHPESFLITTCCCLCLRSRAFVSETEHEESYITASCRWIPHKSLFGLRQMPETPRKATGGECWTFSRVQRPSQHKYFVTLFDSSMNEMTMYSKSFRRSPKSRGSDEVLKNQYISQ